MTYVARISRPTVSARTLGAISFAAAILIVVAGNYNVHKGDNGGTGPALFTSIICLVLAVALFGFVVPRAQNLDRTALVLGIIAVLSIVAFWSGVTPVLAAAAVAVTGRGTASPTRAVVVVQALALIAALVALVVTLAESNMF